MEAGECLDSSSKDDGSFKEKMALQEHAWLQFTGALSEYVRRGKTAVTENPHNGPRAVIADRQGVLLDSARLQPRLVQARV